MENDSVHTFLFDGFPNLVKQKTFVIPGVSRIISVPGPSDIFAAASH